MRRQNSEQFRKLRDFWKLSKESQAKDHSPIFPSTKSLHINDLETIKSPESKSQNKWNGPIPIKPTVPLFHTSPPADTNKQKFISSINNLDEGKLAKLIEYIDNIDKPENAEAPKPRPYRVKRSEKLRKRSSRLFELKLVSNQGNPSITGLGRLEFFDENSKKISLGTSSISVKHSPNCTDPGLLLSSSAVSDTSEMWVSSLPSSKKIRICVKVPVDYTVCGVRIWNYCSSSSENIGAKEAELWLDRERAWKGELKKGKATEIALLAGFEFQDFESKVIKTVNSKVRLVHAPVGDPKPAYCGLRKYSRSELKLGTLSERNKKSESKQLIEEHSLNLIPELPTGRKLRINLISNWGDQNYIGLCGIEFWDENGSSISFQHPELQVFGVNVVSEFKGDARTPPKLVDGVYWTCDDSHAWLAPFCKGQQQSLVFDFLKVTKLSMIRIWNYNKSRIHSYKGVKDAEIFFDDNVFVFKGEITKAPGTLSNAEQYCEYIAFTKSAEVIGRIAEKDWVEKLKENASDVGKQERKKLL